MKIAFIGVGAMGAAIVPHLVANGHEVSAWARRPEAVAGLAGVAPLASPAQAFTGHDVVITMLADDAAVRAVLLDSGALASATGDPVHVVMSTVSPALVAEMQPLHRQAGVAYVAAPVFGVPAVAARAELNILAAGAEEAVRRVQPLFDAIGRKTWRLGDDPVRAAIAKIAGNMMITMAIESMAEAATLTESYGLPAADFLEVLTQTLFACPSYQRYGRNIAERRYEPGFRLALGLKDALLAGDAAKARGVDLPGAAVVRDRLQHAVRAGRADQDWSALAEVGRRST
ncbi:NAD(P)-dependent oxidoreductase [Xylophilus sp. GOD-11R]|uniref:NAD(P)-dependent oxidoreductase n=1 Tax=Xylophilus sp. GOD-11R TaxID=3089814 RepID=UPI00298D43AB|nr:NAD(P)-dependent oxidoreductase [Xylophilus sp. GOD-11R]WPB58269.1 NAD(P)-dependent oxidoreductase [Xylophilus sp. GOD-11R]